MLARLDTIDRPPAVLRNRVGRGQAILVATSEASMREERAFWSALLGLAIQGPTLTCSDPGRYRAILTQAKGAHVLHVIDRHVTRPDWQPAPVTITLNPERLGSPTQLHLLGSGEPVPVMRRRGRLSFDVAPAPAASVAVR